MLTKLEMLALDRIYLHCCKSITTPVQWKNGKMSLKRNHSAPNVYNWITWILLLLTLASRCSMLPKLISERDINGSIIHGMFLIYNFAGAVLKLNIWLNRVDLVQLINDLLHINSVWGM